MKTKLIGMKEFRQNLASYTKKSMAGNIRYIILKKNIPMLEVTPIDEKKFAKENFEQEIRDAYESYKKGKFYSQKEVMKEFGLL